jgi:hypothetical protein
MISVIYAADREARRFESKKCKTNPVGMWRYTETYQMRFSAHGWSANPPGLTTDRMKKGITIQRHSPWMEKAAQRTGALHRPSAI